MRSLCFVLFLCSVAFAASIPQSLSDNEQFQDIVEYLDENASGNDIYNLIDSFSDILDDVSLLDDARSLNSAVHDLINAIPWARVSQYVQAKLSNDPKFAKLFAMINDPKFRKLIDNVVGSEAIKGFLHSVETKGFTWPAFINFALKAICETAIVSNNTDDYSEGVCKDLRKL